MDLDLTTYADLSLFHSEEEFSVFHRLNFTRTSAGKQWLLQFFNHPFSDIARIRETQDVVKTILGVVDNWPVRITMEPLW